MKCHNNKLANDIKTVISSTKNVMHDSDINKISTLLKGYSTRSSQPAQKIDTSVTTCFSSLGTMGGRDLKSVQNAIHDILKPYVSSNNGAVQTELNTSPDATFENFTSGTPILSANANISQIYGATISHIPKSSRLTFATKYEQLIDQILLDTHNTDCWLNWMFFPLIILKKTQEKEELSLAKLIRHRIMTFESFESHCRNLAPPTMMPKANKRNHKKSKSKPLFSAINEKLTEGNVKGAVKCLTSDDTLAPPTVETIEALVNKHPPPKEPITCFEKNEVPLSVSPVKVIEAIQSFPSGSSHGIDGLKPQHIKEILQSRGDFAENPDNTFSTLLNKLTRIINIILSGSLPSSLCPIFFSGRLVAFNKKCGGIRPIAIGTTIRRICSKLCVANIKEEAIKQLSPIQVGFGIPGGAETLVHCSRHFLHNMTLNDCLIKLDFTNAFNTIERNSFLSIIHSRYPSIHNFVYSNYHSESNLYLNDNIISSRSGVQQGDPLGPVLFSLALCSITHSLNSPFNAWFLDDGSIGGEGKQMLNVMKSLVPACQKIGLEINLQKSEIISNNQAIVHSFTDEFPDIKPTRVDDVEMLGVPIGSEVSAQKKLDEFVLTLNGLKDKLSMISKHQAVFLLQKCLGIPKLIYFLRTTNTCALNHKELDDCFQDIICSILNLNLEGDLWSQASLPVANGGLGVRKVSELAKSCYLASINSNKALITQMLHHTHPDLDPVETPSYAQCFIDWTNLANQSQPPANDKVCKQKEWDSHIIKNTLAKITASGSTETRARLLSCQHKASNAWLHCLPSANLGLLLSDEAFRLAVGLHMGAKLCEPHACLHCGVPVGENASHVLHCKGNSQGIITRHNSINKVFANACKKSSLGAIIEPKNLTSSSSKNPDGITLQPFAKGKCLVWDITVIDPTAPSYRDDASKTQGSSAAIAFKRKHDKYSHLDLSYNFVPLAIECHGFIHPNSLKTIKEVARQEKITCAQNDNFLLKNISIALQRGNSQILSEYFNMFCQP